MFSMNIATAGLGTTSVTLQTAGPYVFSGKFAIPTLTNGGGVSSLVITVTQNGTSIYTGPAGAEGFRCEASCAVGDVMNVVLSSSNANDEGLNVIKGVISISSGV